MFEYHTLNDLIKLSADNNLEIWEIIQQADMYENDRSESDSFNMMKEMYVAMKNADSMYDGTLRSASNKAGGDDGLLHSYNESGKNICGSFMGKVMEKAIKMGESNACMRRIVAAPTAGSCGVLPAVLLSYEEDFDVAEDDMVKAMYVAAGIGKVIAENAFIAGAAGGCQAEIGSASAMAAGALAFLQGGDSSAIINAATLSLKNFLGLVCDPVAGLVEVPCIKRNSYGAVNAVTSAQLSLAGIKSAIAPDDVVDSMRRIGNQLPASLKETSCGGLAITESAQNYLNQSF
ncbi:L-serine ammonia-lyase, iron-sulfur-dependent, subunit alpha [Agathobacter rectalis]|uniref:L-serine dehydratase n=1 Tax=Agathobacter rectalis TaxID=39491 RepID=A0AAW4WPV3_9FIRM|nr:L-serine ammonia-lyase, iron-sulfur-dependent, subunit alpha [Agathobacter rectalis]MCC2748654.1 L-serine ammonia-lyase, iron-sulfur-dependent, subunit alpha [Agathobacter rectalis]NSI37047.1 L-serine ammonia-lyase, iron-sulfur-dependent, subunit alpha [Agathobacter rectalis]NSI40316.1 L-serine ammonia-lyase, iron-sulfur-dependent, subunit alpha [Agathobacter rectalis]NSI69779.1 L-serine ammonia-lyase, iron-sulfur-dependent, subunit alpha [Agathobacter rectalis]NSI75699.1 L-serine ammonia-l